MTDDTQSKTYTAPLADLTAGEALQKLYSYSESTGTEIGGLFDRLADTPPGTDCDALIERVQENSESFRSPDPESDRHFTDILGDAREAADTGDTETALELLDRVIIDQLSDTVSMFETVESGAIEHHAVDEETVAYIQDLKQSYEYMLELARARSDTTGSPRQLTIHPISSDRITTGCGNGYCTPAAHPEFTMTESTQSQSESAAKRIAESLTQGGNPTLDDPDVHVATREEFEDSEEIIKALMQQEVRSPLDDSNCCNGGNHGFRTYKTDLPVIQTEDIKPGRLVYRPTTEPLQAYEIKSRPYENEHGAWTVDVLVHSRSHAGDNPTIRVRETELFLSMFHDELTFLQPETVQETLADNPGWEDQ